MKRPRRLRRPAPARVIVSFPQRLTREHLDSLRRGFRRAGVRAIVLDEGAVVTPVGGDR